MWQWYYCSGFRLTLIHGSEERTIRRERDRLTSVGKVPVLAIPDSRFIDRSEASVGPSIDSHGSLRENGARHFALQLRSTQECDDKAIHDNRKLIKERVVWEIKLIRNAMFKEVPD